MARLHGIATLTTNLTAAGTPQPISATAVYCSGFEVYSPSANVGANMYINNSGGTSATQRPIPKGNSWSPPDIGLKGTNGQYDLSKVYFDGDTTNDDIIVTYTTITRDTD